MSKRTLTLLVEFEESWKPEWIWGCHKLGVDFHGVYIKVICEGDQIKDDGDEDNNVLPILRS